MFFAPLRILRRKRTAGAGLRRVLILAGIVWNCLLAAHLSAVEKTDTAARVEGLLAQMTLDEKIGQMMQVDSKALAGTDDVRKYFLGSVLSGGSSDPATGNTAKDWLDFVEAFQNQALQTRLKIPILYGIDAVHGHNNIEGAVIFPHNIGMGATRNPKLMAEAAHITAEELIATGIRWTFAPCVAVARNECWGRTYESYGESPKLVSKLGVAAVRGLQGNRLSDPTAALACAKHFLGDGGTTNGVDEGNTICDEATLRKLFLPPYRAALKAGVGSIMVSYSSWNGKKMSGNKYLLTDVLKGELGFKGVLISDWAAIDQISPDYKNDVEQSINAGLDMVMIPYGRGHTNNYVEFFQDLKDLVKSGKVPESRIDDAVRRILKVKFQMGLFENPFTGHTLLATVGSPEHRAVARECVRESVVLLKNENHTLPLAKNLKRLHVVGAASADLGMQCGGWTISWQGHTGEVTSGGTTLLDAIRKAISPETEMTFSADGNGAKGADAVVVVVGEKPYAEGKGDCKDLRLSDADLSVIQRAKSAKVPIILVLYSGRPLILGPALADCAAILAAWLPGTEGSGVADVLFGDYKPTGKLPRIWPKDNSQLAIPASGEVADAPQFPFGFGLTY